MDPRLIAFARLLQIMDELRERCPWDQKQTFETLRNLTIEETYEMADAITDKDYSGLEGELGDFLMSKASSTKFATNSFTAIRTSTATPKPKTKKPLKPTGKNSNSRKAKNRY